MSTLSRYEQETIINYNNGDKMASIYSADPVVINRLEKLRERFPEHYKLIEENEYSKTYECSKKLIRYAVPRIYTDEEKQKMAERLRKNNNKG